MFKVLAVLVAALAALGGQHWWHQQQLQGQTCQAGDLRTAHAANSTGTPRIRVLHDEARIFLYENFLTPAECDHIVALAEPHLQRSGVVDSETGDTKIDNVRTSKGMFLSRGQDSTITDIEARLAKWTLLPVGNGEGMQVLKYDIGQEYEGHFDYFFDTVATANGGNRYLTVIMYLNDVEEGGETCFPNIPVEVENGPEFSDCARKVLAVKPRKGDAVLFHSIKPTGELERRSMHTACPVLKGTKYGATKWKRVGHFAQGGETPVRVEQVPQADNSFPDCKDRNDLCAGWASSGECEKNPAFMIGTVQAPGQCVRSCGKCAEFAAAKEGQAA